MTVIHKFEIYDGIKISVHVGAVIRSVGWQDANRVNAHIFYAWIEHDPELPSKKQLEFRIIATGQEIPSNIQYIDTVHWHDVREVWHIYYRQV